MRRVNAVGYYGWDNFGDELFRASIQHNREWIWGAGARVRTFVLPVRALHQNLGVAGRVTRLIETLVGAVWCDTVALCGGSVLEDVKGAQSMRRAVLHRRRDIEGLGISLGPWPTDDARERVRAYVTQMSRVIVRDRASMERLGDAVSVGGDLAALYPMPQTSSGERKHLTICVSNDSGTSVGDLVAALAELVRNVDLPIKMLALNVRRSFGDVEFSERVCMGLRPYHSDIELQRFESVDQAIRIISESRAVWSQRLHGLIVAYLCNVPILALSHHQKITDFASDIGLEDRFLAESLEIGEGMRSAAADTLLGACAWELPPEEYVRATTASFSTGRQK